jgi:hypothetical protein
MSVQFPRRRLRAASTALGLAAALLAPPLYAAGPAEAAPAPDSGTGLTAPRVYHVAPHGGRKRPERDKRLHIRNDGAGKGTLTMDVSGANGTLRLKKFGGPCTESGGVTVVCEVGPGYNSWADWAGALPVAAPGSSPGDTGVLRTTFRASDGSTSRADTRVVVGGPILEIHSRESVSGLRPGAETRIEQAVRNAGETTAEGIALQFTVGEDLALTRRYANCRYSGPEQQTAYCAFPDLRLRPGRTAVLKPALGLRTPKVLGRADLRQSAWPLETGPYEGVLTSKDGTPGDGPRLEAEIGTATGPGTWSDRAEEWTVLKTDNPADFAAIGATVSGAPGEEHDVEIGVRNKGPADPGGNAAGLRFTVPTGSRVVKEPQEEIDDDVFEPLCDHREKAGRTTYTCPLSVHTPGRSETLTFRLRLGTAADDGRVQVTPAGDEPTQDPDRSNDTARVTVRRTAPGEGDGSSDGHPLAWTAGGLAAVAVAAGGGLFLVRRRKAGPHQDD